MIEHGANRPFRVSGTSHENRFHLTNQGGEVGCVQHREQDLKEQGADDDVGRCMLAKLPGMAHLNAGLCVAIHHEQNAGEVTVRTGQLKILGHAAAQQLLSTSEISVQVAAQCGFSAGMRP